MSEEKFRRYGMGFFINRYDYEGDVWDDGIFITINETTVLKFKTTREIELFSERILGMIPEIKENGVE